MKIKNKKRLVVCDYEGPFKYTFPNFGLGSTEKRFWQMAKTVSEFNDFEVILTGPYWLPKYVPKAKYFNKHLGPNTVEEFLDKFGKADYLFAGSEYFDKDEYIQTFLKVSHKLISYVTHIYNFKKVCFDGKIKHLFCYSNEMMKKYKKQSPHKLLLFHTGVDEVPYLTKHPKNYLIWLGRIDEDKSPHYAILAAKKLNIPIYILGDTLLQPEYKKKYKNIFNSKLVKLFGTIHGQKKTKLLSEARCGIYTCGPNFTEAGASTLGEMMCFGLPIAGISWRGNDAVCEAVNNKKLGSIVIVNKKMNEKKIVDKLAQAIKKSIRLNRELIYKIGNHKFNMNILMKKMFKIVDNS